MSIQGRFKPAKPVYINGAEAYENEISGFPHKVITWRGALTWHRTTCPVDKLAISEKRDRFHKRSDVCFAIAEAGVFEWSLAFCPNVDGSQTKRPLHCQFCGSQHNWCIFYRRENDGSFLGYSGCDCFHEVLANIKHPAIEEVTKAAREERARAEKFRKTMEKIIDFKRDFPGLYENREWLSSAANPYQRLWQEVENQLNRAEGVDEEFLASCANGERDRHWGGYRSEKYARRLPDFLKWASKTATTGNFNGLKNELLERSYSDTEVFPFKRQRPGSTPAHQPWTVQRTPVPAPQTSGAPVQPPQQTVAPAAPVAAPVVSAGIQAKAKDLANKGLDWSSVIQRALRGQTLSAGQERWVNEQHDKIFAAKKDDKPEEPQEGRAPLTPDVDFTVPVT